jgi:hypothetical protein
MAVVGKQVVGVGLLEQVDYGEWWLEKPRIRRPDHVKGIRRALYHYGIRRAEDLYKGTLRFAISVRDRMVPAVVAETGCMSVGRRILYRARGLRGNDDNFRSMTDEAVVRAYLDASPNRLHTPQLNRFVTTWSTLTDGILRLSRENTFTWHGWRHDPNLIDGVIRLHEVFTDDDPPTLSLSFLDASIGQLAVMAHQARILATALDYTHIEYWLPTHPPWLVAIEQAGWRRRMNGKDEIELFQHTLGASIASGTNEVGN